MSRSDSSPPPPPLTITNSNQQQQQQLNILSTTNPPPSLSSTSTSTSTSVVIVIIVIASAIIISASLYLLLRFLSRRFHSSPAPPPPILHPNFTNSKHHSISSLPLFTLNSLPAKISGGDCAVCLSKFEPDDQLRLLPLCCHAFHADCIDTWLVSNLTCPLCRSTVHPSLSDALDKILLPSRSNSFRVEIGSVSRRRSDDDFSGDAVRSYTIGSFEYVVDEEVEVPIRDETHRRDVSDKDSIPTAIEVSIPVPPGDELAAEVAVERGSWLRDYVDRIATVSSRSFRSSGRIFGGSSRRSNAVVGVDDLEANSRFGEEISELFQWLSRV